MVEISIIIPVIHADAKLFCCLSSVNNAFKGQLSYEIILVAKNKNDFCSFNFVNTLVVQESSKGIYAAMNDGICCASGKFLFFLGQDDILLPMAADAILNNESKCADIVLGDVFWGKERVFYNSIRATSLVSRNWCHQGVLYLRTFFIQNLGSYPTKYLSQGDHYANIMLASVPGVRIAKYNGCIAWYSCKGFSTQYIDLPFRNEFPHLVKRRFGLFWALWVKLRRAVLFFSQLIVRNVKTK